MDDCDIQMNLGGHRIVWTAVSERGREWAARHADLTTLAPEGVECQARFGEDLIDAALLDGLAVKAGHVKVSLW
jgi:alkanesulfonate monooxygenase SsuD/methylene tetrahydromethanopterin reductase-like flavin-dependent oxidoreductase (luciferase family)